MNELQHLVEMLDASKTEHILPNDNTAEYNEGYVKGMNVAMNRIKELSLFNVVGQSEQLKSLFEKHRNETGKLSMDEPTAQKLLKSL